jgi:hypothetical protein
MEEIIKKSVTVEVKENNKLSRQEKYDWVCIQLIP